MIGFKEYLIESEPSHIKNSNGNGGYIVHLHDPDEEREKYKNGHKFWYKNKEDADKFHKAAIKDGYKSRIIKESVEQLDELSKDVLKSYIKKAFVSADALTGDEKIFRRLHAQTYDGKYKKLQNRAASKFDKRMKGIDQADKKLYSESNAFTTKIQESENNKFHIASIHINQLKKSGFSHEKNQDGNIIEHFLIHPELGSYHIRELPSGHLGSVKFYGKGSYNEFKGISGEQLNDHISKKIQKESVEELDELSKEVLTSYIDKAKKAQTDHRKLSDELYQKGLEGGFSDIKDRTKTFKNSLIHSVKGRNKYQGIIKAAEKLNK